MALRCGFFVYMLGGIKEKSEAAILDPYPKRRASTPCKMNKENGQPHFGCISLRYEYTPKRASFPHYSVLTCELSKFTLTE